MVARVVAESSADACFLAAAWCAERAARALESRGAFTVALAGGESPKPFYAALAARTDVDLSRWTLLLGDERCVADTDPRSNLRGVREALLQRSDGRVHPMFTGGADLDAMARAYERTLAVAAGDPPVLDLVVLGLGGDAHTLSLHPGCAAIVDDTRDVVALVDPPMNPAVSRLTLTPRVVRRARAVLLLGFGAAKASAVHALLDAPDDRSAVPAQIVRDATGEVVCFFDRAAMGATAS